jgi:predicted amidohydrolase
MTRVAAVQMNSTDNVEENLATLQRWVSEAATKQGAQLVVVPENAVLMGLSEEDKLKIAENPEKGPIQDFFSNLAKTLNVWIVGGTLPLIAFSKSASSNKKLVYASSITWNNQGKEVARYDKMHLFDVQVQPNQEEYFESHTICPGEEIVSVDSPFGKLGFTICYDLRFPELYRKLFNEGVEIFTVPSAFTAITGKAHWEPLLRARAIENFSYVIAANQVGKHRNERSTWGHTMIVDPWGTILGCLPEEEGVVVAEIDLDYLNDLRRRFPVREHRRIF